MLASVRKKTTDCSICGKKFYDGQQVKQHIQKWHVGVTPHKCPQEGCSKYLGSARSLKEHIEGHDNPNRYPCPIPRCKKSFSNEKRLQAHVPTHGYGKLQCPVCKKYYKSERNFAEHRCKPKMKELTLEQQKPFLCDSCGHRYGQEKDLKAHQVSTGRGACKGPAEKERLRLKAEKEKEKERKREARKQKKLEAAAAVVEVPEEFSDEPGQEEEEEEGQLQGQDPPPAPEDPDATLDYIEGEGDEEEQEKE